MTNDAERAASAKVLLAGVACGDKESPERLESSGFVIDGFDDEVSTDGKSELEVFSTGRGWGTGDREVGSGTATYAGSLESGTDESGLEANEG